MKDRILGATVEVRGNLARFTHTPNGYSVVQNLNKDGLEKIIEKLQDIYAQLHD